MVSRFSSIGSANEILDDYFSLIREQDGWISVTHDYAEMDMAEFNPSKIKKIKKNEIQLLRVNNDLDLIQIFPVFTLPNYNFLKPKYDKIKRICFQGFNFSKVERGDDVFHILDELPSGFIKDPNYGLGLLKDFRFILESIEDTLDVKSIVITKNAESKINHDSYILNFKDYDALRKAINRTHKQALSISKLDKEILSHNSLLSNLDIEKFPPKTKPYKKDTIFKTLLGTEKNATEYSDKDNLAAFNVIKKGARDLVKIQPSELLELQREIELVTLEALISKLDGYINQNLNEDKWQQLFLDNPFILSLAFGVPLVVIDGRVSVGGGGFSGGGNKIADFFYKNKFSDNITLIEIKTSKTKISGSKYRGVIAPSVDLAGSITQILEQRYELQKNIASLKDSSKQYDLETFFVKCILVIGMAPVDQAEKKSFELFRNNLNDVIVITFDELLEKLRMIFKFLSPISIGTFAEDIDIPF